MIFAFCAAGDAGIPAVTCPLSSTTPVAMCKNERAIYILIITYPNDTDLTQAGVAHTQELEERHDGEGIRGASHGQGILL